MNAIALIDCNNFFVSCEALFNPALIGKAVCVLSSNDGCIIARSNEAKKLGVRMGMPYFMAKKQFRNITYISGNLALYNEISSRVMKKLHDYTPDIEIYSIDEAFLDLNNTRKMHGASYEEIIEKIKTEIKSEIGIDVSIGLSYSKTLAKLASKKAKTKDGLYKIGFYDEMSESNLDISVQVCERVRQIGEDRYKIQEELSKTPIEDIWGIGANTAILLKKHFIRTALDLTNQSDSWIKRIMGKIGLDLKQELLGNSINPVKAGASPPKSIQKTASFPQFSNNKNYIKNELYRHSHRVCKKLRRLMMTGQVLIIMLRTKDFQIQTCKIQLEKPIDSEFEINKTISDALEKLYCPISLYRSCGLTVAKLSSTEQLSLLASKNTKGLSDAWDKIDDKFGYGKLHLGANGVNKN